MMHYLVGWLKLRSLTADAHSLFMFVIVLFVKMDEDNHRSSDIYELIEEDDSNIVYKESESDIEAEDVPDDVILEDEVSLEDFSSGSGDDYVPDLAELSSSDEESDQGRPVPVVPLGLASTSTAPIPVGAPTKPAWVRVNPPEPEVSIEPNFQVRNTGPRNMPPRNSLPITYFYCFFSIDVLNTIVRQTNYHANKNMETKRASIL